MLLLFYIMLFILAILVFCENEKHYFWGGCFFVLLLYIFSFNTDNNDYIPYKTFYDGYSYSGFSYITNNSNSSPLFSVSVKLGRLLGLDFNFYRLFIFLIISLIFYFVLRKHIEFGCFLILYSIFPFFLDLVQLRYFLSVGCIFFAIICLLNEKKVLFLILTIVSSLFHSMNIVFIFLLFLPFGKKLPSKFSKILCGIAVLIVCLRSAQLSVVNILINNLNRISFFDEYRHYLDSSVKNGYLLYFIYQIFNIVFAYYIDMRLQKETEINEFQQKIVNFNLNFQLMGMLFVILTTININFSRYFRVIYIINAVAFSALLYQVKTNKKSEVVKNDRSGHLIIRNYKEILCCIGWVLIWILGENTINGSLPNIMNRVFNSL